MKKVALLIAGNFSLSLGVAGIFLPVLPTTPFLLLSAACYMKSSGKLYNWLINHRILGLYVRSYILYKAISVKAKVISIVTLWVVMISTIAFIITLLWLRILLFFIALCVTAYLLSIKRLTIGMLDDPERE